MAYPIKVYWHNPAPIFVARVNMAGTINYPVASLTYDSVTVGSYANIEADMFFTLGSAEGLDDYGRGRIRTAATATTLKVGRSPQGFGDGELNVEDNAWIHVYPDWRVQAKLPYLNPATGVMYKDADIPVGDHWEKPDPIANAGPGYARTISPSTGKIRVFLPGSTSIPVADGATIVSYLWDEKDGDILFGDTNTDADVTMEFPPGFRFVKLTATDSNGKSHVTRIPILADDPADSLCVRGMQVTNITRRQEGVTMTMRTLIDLPRADYPDGALVMAWMDYDEASGLAPDAEDRYQMLFIGWHESDNAGVQATETALLRNTTLQCVDVAGRLDRLPGFPLLIELPFEDDPITWSSMASPNMDKYIAHILTDHSTAAGVTDVFLSGTGADYAFVSFDSAGESLYRQVQRQANRMVPDHNFTCNEYGQLCVIVDPMLQNVDDRTSTVQGAFTAQWIQGMQFPYQRTPRVNTLRASAALVQTEWLTEEDDDDVLLFAYSVAPGTSPGQGLGESDLGERLAKTQQDLNDCVGHHYARMNARYGLIAINAALGDAQGISPARMTWVPLLTTAATAPQRSLDFTTIRSLAKEVSINFSYPDTGRVTRASVTVEVETVGLPAVTDTPVEALPVGEQPPPPLPYVPDYGLVEGVQNVVAIGNTASATYLLRTSDFQTPSASPTTGGPTWDDVLLGLDSQAATWIVDPFSPGYRGVPGGSIDSFLVTSGNIYKVTNMFGTPSLTILHAFPVSTADRMIACSFGRYFPDESDNPWIMVVSDYNNVSPYREWVTYSKDGGQTWSTEVKLTANASTTSFALDANIGMYMSPRTPGMAFVNGGKSHTGGLIPIGQTYKTTDWGDTFEEIDSPEITQIHYRAYPIHVPWNDNDDEQLAYYGTRQRLTSPTRGSYRLKRVNGSTIDDISPSTGGYSYGAAPTLFGIRAHDNDRQFMVVAGFANDESSSAADDKHAIFVSIDGGGTWTLSGSVIEGAPSSFEAPLGVAFAGDTPDVIFAWGQRSFLRYSSDFGATWDYRQAGIFAAIGEYPTILGIAGGPTA